MAGRRVLSARVDGDLAEWAETYAQDRGVSRAQILEAALKALREDAQGGVPELPSGEEPPGPGAGFAEKLQFVAMVDAQLQAGGEYLGVGNCPGRPGTLGHIWKSYSDDPNRGCRFCEQRGRRHHSDTDGPEGFIETYGRARSEVLSEMAKRAAAQRQAKRDEAKS